MFNTYTGNDANSVWWQAADDLVNGASASQMTRLGESRELIHVGFQITDPRQRWISARSPAISPAFAIAEVFWILSGDNDALFLNYWNPSLPKFAGGGDTYHGAYGYRIKKQFGLDQLEAVYQALLNNPDTRQVVIQLWDPRTDMPSRKGEPADADIPCNICSIPKIRNKRLEWLQVMRSNDVFLGMPYNIIQFTTLQEILAGWLNIDIGEYCQISDSLHAYVHDLDHYSLGESDSLTKNTDILALTKRDSVEVVSEMYRHLQLLTKPGLTEQKLNKAIVDINVPPSYKNLFLINCAYAAKKHNWNSEMLEAVGACRNQVLINIWDLWLAKHRR